MKKIILGIILFFGLSDVYAVDYLYNFNGTPYAVSTPGTIQVLNYNGSAPIQGAFYVKKIIYAHCDESGSNAGCLTAVIINNTYVDKIALGWLVGDNFHTLLYDYNIEEFDIGNTYIDDINQAYNGFSLIEYNGSYFAASPIYYGNSGQDYIYLGTSYTYNTTNYNLSSVELDTLFGPIPSSDCIITRIGNTLRCTGFYDSDDQLINISFYTSVGDIIDVPGYLIEYIGGTQYMSLPYPANTPYFFQRQIPTGLTTGLYNWIIKDQAGNIRGNYQFSIYNEPTGTPLIDETEENGSISSDFSSVELDSNQDGEVSWTESISYPFRLIFSFFQNIGVFFEKIFDFFKVFSGFGRTNEEKTFSFFLEEANADAGDLATTLFANGQDDEFSNKIINFIKWGFLSFFLMITLLIFVAFKPNK